MNGKTRQHSSRQSIRFRWIPLALLFLAALTTLSGYFSVATVRQNNLEIATEGARNIFRMITLTRQWNANHGGVYVPITRDTQPNPLLEHPRRDLQTVDGQQLTLMNPAFMTRQIAELAEKSGRLHLHLTSLRPIRPDNKPDDWEANALKLFEQGVEEQFAVEKDGPVYALRYMAPLLVNQACMQCHAKQGYQIGDVRGGVSISLDFAPIEATMQDQIIHVVGTHLAFFILISSIVVLLLEKIGRQWAELDNTIETLETTRDELVNAEKMASLGRLVAGFAHEINTPIGVAVSAVSHGDEQLKKLEALLAQDEVSEQELRAPLAEIKEGQRLALSNLRRGADLVQRFKRTAINQSNIEKKSFLLHDVIRDVLSSLHNQLKHLPIDVQVVCPPTLACYGAPGLFEQILINLILNAVTHGFANGKQAGHLQIEATTSPDHQYLQLRVSDDGQGIAQEWRNKIFEPFFTTRRDAGGSGLGLYIVYNIVTRELNGSIDCASEPGKGAHFFIECPLVKPPSAPLDPKA